MRNKRFERGEVAPIKLTELDRYILRTVYTHRFIRSTHISALLKSPQYPLRRLNQLYHHGYLERPKLQIQYYKAGSEPMVYSLTNKGAQAIGVEKRVEMVDKYPSHHLFQHTLLTTDFLVRMELSAPNWCQTYKRLPIDEWKVKLYLDGRRSERRIIPDGVFSLDDQCFMLETDTGSMPLTRGKNEHQNSIRRKMLVYKEAWRQGVFPFKNCRVIWYTHGEDRAQRMKALSDSSMHLFTTQEEIETCINGDVVKLLQLY